MPRRDAHRPIRVRHSPEPVPALTLFGLANPETNSLQQAGETKRGPLPRRPCANLVTPISRSTLGTEGCGSIPALSRPLGWPSAVLRIAYGAITMTCWFQDLPSDARTPIRSSHVRPCGGDSTSGALCFGIGTAQGSASGDAARRRENPSAPAAQARGQPGVGIHGRLAAPRADREARRGRTHLAAQRYRGTPALFPSRCPSGHVSCAGKGAGNEVQCHAATQGRRLDCGGRFLI